MNDEGVKYYTEAEIRFRFGFPENHTTCQYCIFCYPNTELKRFRCRITDEILVRPFTERGMRCPAVVLDTQTIDNNE